MKLVGITESWYRYFDVFYDINYESPSAFVAEKLRKSCAYENGGRFQKGYSHQ